MSDSHTMRACSVRLTEESHVEQSFLIHHLLWPNLQTFGQEGARCLVCLQQGDEALQHRMLLLF